MSQLYYDVSGTQLQITRGISRQRNDLAGFVRNAAAIKKPKKPVKNVELLKGDLKELPTECPICYDEMKDENEAFTLKKCSHTFHERCIKKYVFRFTGLLNGCPLCRQEISMIEIDAPPQEE